MDGKAFRLYALGLAACYPFFVVFMASWKLFMGVSDKALPWVEVAYGPAITIASAFMMILALGGVANVASRLKDRARSRPHP
jgi:hypothetical protein